MKKNKRIVSLMMATIMTAAALVGCGGKETEVQEIQMDSAEKSETEGEVTELKFWYSWTDKIQENNIALTEEFNETVGKELGIHVTAEYQGTYDDLNQKLQAAYVAGETPDVSVMEIGSITPFSAKVLIEPISITETSGVSPATYAA